MSLNRVWHFFSKKSAAPQYNNDENVSLITMEREVCSPTLKEGWLAWGWQRILKPGLLIGLSIITAIPSSINALVAPENAEPKHIVDKTWWNRLSPLHFLHSITNGFSSLIINVLLNLYFFPIAAEKSYQNMRDLKRYPLRQFTAIIFGIGGAIGAAMIAYEAFLWFPTTSLGRLLAITAAGLNFTVYAATRYVAVSNLLEKFSYLINLDMARQKKLGALLSHINPLYQNEYDRIQTTYQALREFHAQDKAPCSPSILSDDLIQPLIELLSAYMTEHPDFLLHPSKREQVLKIGGIIFDLSFAFTMFVPSTLTFMQAGFNGISKTKELCQGESLGQLNPWAKRTLGAIPGLASGVLYGSSAFELRDTLIQVFHALNTHRQPKEVVCFALLLISNLFSMSSMQNVATQVVNNKDNIAFVSPNAAGNFFILINALSSLNVNLNASCKKTFLTTSKGTQAPADLQQLSHLLTQATTPLLSNNMKSALQHSSLFAQKGHRLANAPAKADQILLRV